LQSLASVFRHRGAPDEPPRRPRHDPATEGQSKQAVEKQFWLGGVHNGKVLSQ
jgi:hypothetical protein